MGVNTDRENADKMIACTTLDGQTKLVSRNKLQFRPAAYAIIFHLDRILLLNTRTTNSYSLPGGGIEIGETLEQGLKREVKEEAGIEIEIKNLHHFSEEFFYYEPTNEAFHSYRFFYICNPKTVALVSDDKVQDGEVEKPRWVKIQDLQADHFQSHGNIIINLIESRQQSKLKQNDVLNPAGISFQQGWQESMTGETLPLNELWAETNEDDLPPECQFDYHKAKPNRFAPLKTREKFASEDANSSAE